MFFGAGRFGDLEHRRCILPFQHISASEASSALGCSGPPGDNPVGVVAVNNS